jgi:hypothetical protein
MAGSIRQSRSQWPLTILILLEGLILSLCGLHVIPSSWAIAAFFAIIIPFATLKAFADFLRR